MEEAEKKEKKICSTDLQTCVIKKKCNVSFALQFLPSLQPYLILDTEKVERYYCAAG